MALTMRIEYQDLPDRRVLNLEKAGAQGVPVLGLTRHTCHVNPVIEHVHPGIFEFGLCLRGALTLSSRDRIHTIMPGQIFINQPGIPHRLTAQPRGLFLYWMQVDLVAPEKGTLLKLPKREARLLCEKMRGLPTSVVPQTQHVRQAFLRLFQQYDSPPGTYRSLCVRQACLSLLIELLECSAPQNRPTDSERIRAIIAQMRRTPERDYRIDDLAHQAALSPTHFINLFKRATGLPPIHFLLDCRMDAAKRLLRTTSGPVTEIALTLGFSSSQHFANQFKRATGLTPRAWRNGQKERAHGR
ncbi:MAG TPA: AraC family transcriptional regulator [Kiritimatiellia bacterium]|nr:AraC family transcriptional regulator [Kiritimatiellia bacterium]HPS06224.1 AraC family transcriptional regulator [Kiritimatiellia bacterium]